VPLRLLLLSHLQESNTAGEIILGLGTPQAEFGACGRSSQVIEVLQQ